MGDWFLRHRQDFIRDQLKAFGQIRRADIANRFDITVQVASADISRFIDTHPDVIVYDGRAKCYVLNLDAINTE